jgi:hypothetical protein
METTAEKSFLGLIVTVVIGVAILHAALFTALAFRDTTPKPAALPSLPAALKKRPSPPSPRHPRPRPPRNGPWPSRFASPPPVRWGWPRTPRCPPPRG